MSRKPRTTVIAIAFAIVFAGQAIDAFADCGDYLYVRGEATTMTHHGNSSDKTAAQSNEAITDQTTLVANRLPADSPCSNGRCDNDDLPTAPPKPLPTTVDVNDVGMFVRTSCTTNVTPDRRPRPTSTPAASNPAESIDRPPE